MTCQVAAFAHRSGLSRVRVVPLHVLSEGWGTAALSFERGCYLGKQDCTHFCLSEALLRPLFWALCMATAARRDAALAAPERAWLDCGGSQEELRGILRNQRLREQLRSDVDNEDYRR